MHNFCQHFLRLSSLFSVLSWSSLIDYIRSLKKSSGEDPRSKPHLEGSSNDGLNNLEGVNKPRQTDLNEANNPRQTYLEGANNPRQTNLDGENNPRQTNMEGRKNPTQTNLEEVNNPRQRKQVGANNPRTTNLKELNPRLKPYEGVNHVGLNNLKGVDSSVHYSHENGVITIKCHQPFKVTAERQDLLKNKDRQTRGLTPPNWFHQTTQPLLFPMLHTLAC